MKRHEADRKEHLGHLVDLADTVNADLLVTPSALVGGAASDAVPQLREAVAAAQSVQGGLRVFVGVDVVVYWRVDGTSSGGTSAVPSGRAGVLAAFAGLVLHQTPETMRIKSQKDIHLLYGSSCGSVVIFNKLTVRSRR